MSDFWPFVVAGLTSGSLYGLAAMGLVLTYKTSGIFNFAHGAIAAGGAYIFYELNTRNDVPWPIAGALVVLVVAPVAGILTERIARGLAEAPPAAKIVATVGLLLAVSGTATAIFGAAAINFPQFLPTRTYPFAGINLGVDQMISMAIALISAAGLYGFFRFSKLGVAMRGVVDNPDLLDLAGTSPARVRTQAWVIGSCFAALSGILLAPYIGLDAILLTLLVVQAFGAAAVGAFTSLPLTYLGGLVVGVGGALATKYVVDVPNLAGFPPSLPFIVLFAVLLLTPKGRFVEAGRRRLAKEGSGLSPALVWGGRIALVGALALTPQVVGTRLPVYTNALIFVLVFLSLRLLVRTSGQVSLCHAAFAAMGAAAFSHFGQGAGLPWPVALVAAGMATVPIGALVAIPAIRLSGLYLALATFGFGILVERMVFGTGLMFGSQGSRSAPRPGEILGLSLGTDKGFYYVSLAVVLAVAVGMFWLNRSRLGRLCQAMADSPVALAMHGANVRMTRVLVFCVSAFIAGLAGALFASAAGSISGIGFGPFASLTWLTVLALAGTGEFSTAVIASFVLAVVPSYVDNPAYTDWQPVMFGTFAVLASLAQGSGLPFAAAIRRQAARHAERSRYSPVAERNRLAAAKAAAMSGGT
jgi:branched-subunit amino acid ABC-type transport system permease component